MRVKTLFLFKIKLKMKNIIGLFALLLILTGCDDGDMTFKSFNFDTGTVQSCTDNGVIYKVQGNEALLLQTAATTFINAESKNDLGEIVAREIQIGSGMNLIYRTYSGPVAGGSICSAVPPASPSVVDEYIAQPGGTISIKTEKRTNDEGVVTGYNHIITIVNAIFTKGEESIIISNNVFGSFVTPVTYRFDFLDDEDSINIQRCADAPKGQAFTVNGDEALQFILRPQTLPTPTEATTTIIDFGLTTESSDIIFSEYSGTALATLFCDVVPPITPVVTKQWEAISGNLRIETTVVGGSTYEHVLYLDNVTFMNRLINTEQFTINTTGGYRLGKLTLTN